jgi:trk system potassium uptake protein TrkA
LEFRAVADDYCNIPLKRLSIKQNILIACIVRRGKTIIPDGDDTIQAKDSVLVVTAGQKLRRLADILQENA